jgi:hypothetical protein
MDPLQRLLGLATQHSVLTNLPCKDIDRLLFNSSTTITIGNGNKARFGHHNWLAGEMPRYLVPHLFMLVRRKNRTVRQELQNGNKIRSLRTKITTTIQIQEFVGLWIRIKACSCSPRHKTPLHGNGRLTESTPLARLIGYSSGVAIEDSNMTSSGRPKQKINAKFTLDPIT